MRANKVIIGGEAKIDLTGVTATAQTVLAGYTAHGADGEAFTGQAAAGGGTPGTIAAGDTIVMINPAVALASSSSALTATGISLQVPKAGTYRFLWFVSNGYSGTTRYSRLYRNGTAVGSQQSTSGTADGNYSLDLACAAGDTVEIWLRGGKSAFGSTIYGCAGMLAACIDWDLGI